MVLVKTIGAFERAYNSVEDGPRLRSVSAEGDTLRVETELPEFSDSATEQEIAEEMVVHEGAAIGLFKEIIAVQQLPTPDGIKGVIVSTDEEDVAEWSLSTDTVWRYREGELTNQEMLERVDESMKVW